VFPLFIIAAYSIELLAYRHLISDGFAILLNIIVVSATIAIPIAVVHFSFADISQFPFISLPYVHTF
jgi:hypothetical protein